MPTWYDLSRESNPLLVLLGVILYQPSPISPFELGPFSAAKPPIQFAWAGLCPGMFPNRLRTQSPKLLDPTSVRATAILAARREAVEAHC